jgi:hypothetical protein
MIIAEEKSQESKVFKLILKKEFLNEYIIHQVMV